jgi:sec-independent protein translocase protein TatA
MHLLVILCIALLIFGPGKLKDLGKGLGEGIRGFKEAIKDEPREGTVTNAPKNDRS